MNSHKGFFQIVIIIVVAVILLAFFGIDPKEIWVEYVLPIIQFGWEAFITVLTFIVDLAVTLANKLGIGV